MKVLSLRGLIVAAVSFASLAFVNSARAEDGIATPIAAEIGQMVQLDPTDGFVATSNIALRPVWSWVSRPATSVADISDVTVLRPTFTVDVGGTYVAQLELFDAADPATSQVIHSLTVEVGTGNLTPVARVVARGTPEAQTSLTLDATQSYDVDGDALTYSWAVESAPSGAVVTIADEMAPLSDVQFDQDGEYVIALTVQDQNGVPSVPARLRFTYRIAGSSGDDDDDDECDDDDDGHDDDDDDDGDGHDDDDDGNCSAEAGRQIAPVATFTFGQVRGSTGTPSTLSSHNSTDIDGDALTSQYSIAVAPTSSVATITQDQDAFAAITPDFVGDYLVSLKVSDGTGSGYDQVLIVTDPAANIRPVARIAAVPNPLSGTAYALNGSQSYDFDGDLLSYRWAVLSKPATSAAGLASSTGPYAEITPDVSGTYIVQLVADDGSAASVPTTMVMVVDVPLPVANAGADVLPDTQSDVTLDGTLSAGIAPVYSWSVLGLASGGQNATLNDVTLAMPDLTLQMRTAAFRDVIKSASVYHLKSNNSPGLCTFDTRLPDDIPNADPNGPIKIKLKARGRQVIDGKVVLVWEIENKKDATQTVRLETQSGLVVGTYVVPGRVSIHVTTPDIGSDKLGAWVGDSREALKRKKTNPFNRNNPVCTGAGSTVVQLIISDGNGISLPDTVFVSPGNLRPVLVPTNRITAQNGAVVSLSALDYAFDANSDPLSYSWSVMYRPQGSETSVDSDPEIKIATGEALDITPDRSGLYLIQITAIDGILLASPAVIEIEVLNAPPIAVATGPTQVFVGEVATLDGSESYDPDGDALGYQWAITSQPVGSTATISEPFGPIATFVPDVRGDYAFSLVVSDYEFTSTAATVALTAPNRAPVAELAGLTDVSVGEEVALTALASTDPDGDALSYVFAIVQAPAGASPTLIDLAEGEAAFVADVAGTYSLQVTVSDGLIDAVATLDITAASGNTAPILGAINTVYTVELGLELVLGLTGSDPDGDAISFFATPLPLPAGITLDAASGKLHFRPEVGQEGSYSFTVGVSDGTLTDSAVLNVDVVPGTASNTSVYGRVLDAVDFANGVETPLAGIPVRLRDAALMATTDANGAFDFGSLTAGRDQILVEPSASGGPGAYIGTIRAIQITENQNRDLAPNFLLTPLNDGCATVIAGQETVLSGVTSGVTVAIAADTIQTTAGDPYAGDVCLGSLPELFNQSGLPTDTQACRIYALDAPGAVFTQGIAISAPNVDQLPEQTRLHLWRQNTSTGFFRRSANADVDTGGATVSSAATSFNDSTLFTFLPQAPQTAASTDQPTGNRALSVFEGDLSETYTLPGYRAFNRSQQVGISYHSTAANPAIIVAGDVTIAADASLPVTLSTRLDIGGLSVSDTADWTPRQGLDGSAPALVGEAVSIRQSMLLDASNLTSGRYDYTFIAKAQFACSTVSSSHNAELYVQNETDSPYGVGWSIDGLQELTEDPDGSVAIIDDSGISTFDPEPSFTNFDDKFVFPAIGVQGLAIADFDGNGHDDIAFGNSGTGAIGFVYNYGNNEYELGEEFVVAALNEVPEDLTLDYAPNLRDVVAIDINNDGLIDIAFGTQLEKRVDYLINNGDGSFTLQSGFQFVGLVRDLEVADFDNDGMDDLAIGVLTTGSFGKDKIYIAYANGSDLDLTNAMPSTTRDHLRQLVSGDIDGDGFVDIVYRGGVEVNFLFNNGDRSYTLYEPNIICDTRFPLGDYSDLGDYNEDGYLDFLYTTQLNTLYCVGPWPDAPPTVDLFLNSGGRTFDSSLRIDEFPLELERHAGGYVFALDANGDNHIDIVRSEVGAIAVYAGLGDGTFLPPERGLLDYELNFVEPFDIDGGGTQDLISAQRFSVTIQLTKPSSTGALIAGPGEFSTLEKQADGTWLRRYKDGNIVEFNADGLQTAEVGPQGNRREFAYGADRQLTTITDQVGGVTHFTYDASGRLASITYPDGRETQFTYDAERLATVTEPTGGTVGFTYDANNRLISTTNQNGNTSQYTYDATGKMNGAILPDGSSIKNQIAASLGLVDGLGGPAPLPRIYVSPEDRVTTVTDRKGQTTEVVVNQFGATVKITDPLGRVTFIDRDENNLATRVERPSSEAGTTRVDTIAYDPDANVTQKTEAIGTAQERSTSYEYEPIYSKVTRTIDADGFETLYTYDATGNALTVSDAEGGLRQLSYTVEGKLATRTDKNGNTTAFIYNTDQNLTETTYADGSVTQMSYDTSGNATLIAEATGTPIERQVQRTYDALNRVLTVEVTAADGAQIDGLTTYAYDPAGNLATIIDETGLTTSMIYDTLERLTAVDDPAEGLIQRTYNTAGEVTQHINGDGETHVYAYDTVSRLTQTTDPEGYIKTFAYDLRDSIKTVTDGRGGLTAFAYDRLDRMTTRTNPLGQTMTRAYDPRDNLTSLTREDGTVEAATYDGLSRRTGVTTPDNTLAYTFDPRGNLTAANDNDSGVSFTYDARNRLATTTTDGTVGPQPAVTLTYGYDALDRRVSLADSLGGSTAYTYDVEDRLTDLTAPWGTVYSFGYDGEGRRTSLTSTSGRASTMGYTNGLLTALAHVQSGVTLTDLVYEYGVDGQLTAIVDNLDPSKSKAISYDALNRLVQVGEGVPVSQGGVPIPVEDYAYDGEGNRTASHLSNLYSSNDHNQLLEDEDYTYAYDSKGNRISKTAKAGGEVETYTYDSQNRLVGYSSPTTTAAYTYDALDRRIAKTVDGVTMAFVYDAWGLSSTANDVLLDFESGALTKRWLHGVLVDEPLGFELYSGTTAGGTGTAHEVFSDRLGSVIEVVEAATGMVVSSQRFDSFGERIATGPLLQRYGFTGREHDAESGLIYYRARTYDPAVGMFLQRDPIGFAAGDLNLYAYVENDPFNWTDPSGLAATSDFALLTGGLLGLGAACYATGACQTAGKAFEDSFNNGFGGGSGSSLDPVGGGDPVSRVASGLGALLGNAWSAMTKAVDGWFSESNPNGNGGSGGSGANGGGASNSPGAAGNDNTGVASTPPGGPEDDDESTGANRTSVNQMNQQIQRGKAPKTVRRVDSGKVFGEQNHVHFRDGNALNFNGTWKHGVGRVLTRAEVKWLTNNGWSLPK